MADYHTVYKEQEGTTTEWEDLQVKFGNREAREKPKVEAWQPKEERDEKSAEALRSHTLEDLEGDLEDIGADDRFLEEYRQKRIAELKAAACRPRFGSVLQISAADFIREVTDASEAVWVVVHLYQDRVPACVRLQAALEELASQYPATKFARAVATQVIPNYPDANVPTLLLYRHRAVKASLVGAKAISGGGNFSPSAIALELTKVGPVLGSPDEEDGQVAERVALNYVRDVAAHHADNAS